MKVAPPTSAQLTVGQLYCELAVRVDHTDGWLPSLGHTVVLDGSLDVPVPLWTVLKWGRKGRRGEERGGESVPGGRLGLKVCVVRMVKRTHLQWHSGHRQHGRSDWLRSIGVLLGS